VSQPLTRDVRKIVESAEIMEAELLFQADRLKQSGSTENEDEHFADLRRGYESAARYVGILKRYQQGRLEKQQQGGERERESAMPTGLDARHRALPIVEAYDGEDGG
jgi:hypothetical protein